MSSCREFGGCFLVTLTNKNQGSFPEALPKTLPCSLDGVKACCCACVQAYGNTLNFTPMVHLVRASWSLPKSARPELLTYNAAITCCCRVGHLGRSLRLLHEMVKHLLWVQRWILRALPRYPDVVCCFPMFLSACGPLGMMI